LTNNFILYVKSEKLPIIQYSEGISGHPCTGGYRAREIVYNLKPEDKEAVDLLEEAKINYKLVDLSDCPFTMRLKAKIIGINETPTLVVNGEKIRGVQNIRLTLLKIKS